MEQRMSAGQALDDLRMPSERVMTMISEVIESMPTHSVSRRIRSEPGMRQRAIELTQNLVVAVALAEMLEPTAPFDSMFDEASFADGDEDLAQMGGAMLAWMEASPRSVRPVQPGLFAQRMKTIRGALR